MREGRGRGDVRLVPADFSGVRELFAALKRGEAVGFLPDQVPGIGEGEWADFFGRPAYTATLAPKLARRADVACFLAYAQAPAARRGLRARGAAVAAKPAAGNADPARSTARSRRWCANAPGSTSGATTATRRRAARRQGPT